MASNIHALWIICIGLYRVQLRHLVYNFIIFQLGIRIIYLCEWMTLFWTLTWMTANCKCWIHLLVEQRITIVYPSPKPTIQSSGCYVLISWYQYRCVYLIGISLYCAKIDNDVVLEKVTYYTCFLTTIGTGGHQLDQHVCYWFDNLETRLRTSAKLFISSYKTKWPNNLICVSW